MEQLDRYGLRHILGEDLEAVAPFLRFAPPGHFYSPIPNLRDVERDAKRIFDRSATSVPGIDLNEQGQREVFIELSAILSDWAFPKERGPDYRYFSGPDNTNYGIGDGMILHAAMRRFRPKRVIEIGSGFSSCMILDTNERFLDGSTELTFIEPHPGLLYSLLPTGEREGIRVLERRLQDVPTNVFGRLEADDLLFIDSTHVARVGSDVCDIFARVLPALGTGVIVHFHDVFWPFEYPKHWIQEGRAWTELYVLRSFLQFNRSFEILLFNDYLANVHRDVIATRLPRMLENTGGALWLRCR